MNKSARVNYHVKKQSTQFFIVDADGIKGNVIAPELVQHNVLVEDVRGNADRLSFKNDGLFFVNNPSSVKQFTEGNTCCTSYETELQALIQISTVDVALVHRAVALFHP